LPGHAKASSNIEEIFPCVRPNSVRPGAPRKIEAQLISAAGNPPDSEEGSIIH
jgi:hypothetical protein